MLTPTKATSGFDTVQFREEPGISKVNLAASEIFLVFSPQIFTQINGKFYRERSIVLASGFDWANNIFMLSLDVCSFPSPFWSTPEHFWAAANHFVQISISFIDPFRLWKYMLNFLVTTSLR